MYFTTLKKLSLTLVFMFTLAVLGIAGPVSSASAAGSITINNGAVVSNYPQVTLTLVNPGTATEMSFRNESGSWSTFEPFAVTKQWTLSAGDGDKKVSVQLRNAGLITVGTFSATIKLDFIIDTTFNGKGYDNRAYVLNTLKSRGNAVAELDGKIISVGTVDKGNGNTVAEIICYKPDGTLDTAFGGSGIYYYGSAVGAHKANAVAINPFTGKIIVVGTHVISGADTDVWVLQLNPNGSLDTSFAGGGSLFLGGTGADKGTAVVIQPEDDKIIVVGTYDNGGVNNTSVWVVRLTPEGALDTSFNGAGNSKFGDGITNKGVHNGNGVALQSDGKIIVTGTYDHGDGTRSFWVLRLLNDGFTDGLIDSSFGTRGTGENTLLQSGPLTSGNAVVISPVDDSIYLAGTYDWTGGNTDALLVKLDFDGYPVTPFGGTNGTVAFGGDGADSASALAIDANGKIVVAGTYDNGGTTSLMVNRVDANGLLDMTFNNGNATYSFGTGGTFAGQALALQSDGKIIVVGKGDNLAGTSSILTLRLQVSIPMNTLTVTTVGAGTVTAFPGTLTWNGATATGSFAVYPPVSVTLTAVPTGGSTFTGWSGPDAVACPGTGNCTVTMDLARSVTATFSAPMLRVTTTGVGTVSGPGGIACADGSSTNCSASYPLNTLVTLSATTAWYSSFTWGGACSGITASTCNVPMGMDKNVTATFTSNQNIKLNSNALYSTLLDSYLAGAAAGSTATIDAQAFTFQENLQLGQALTVTLNGGLGSGFSANPGTAYTTVKGSLKISAGRLNAKYLKVQ